MTRILERGWAQKTEGTRHVFQPREDSQECDPPLRISPRLSCVSRLKLSLFFVLPSKGGRASPVTQTVNYLPAVQETRI